MSRARSWVLLGCCVIFLNAFGGRGNAENDDFGFELQGPSESVFDTVERQKKELEQLRRQVNKLKESQSKIIILEKAGSKKTTVADKEALESKNKIASLEKEKDSLNSVLQEKKNEAEELRAQVQGLKEKLKNSVSQDNAAEVMQKKIDSLQENIIKFNQTIAQKDNENAELKKQAAGLKEKLKNAVVQDNAAVVLQKKIDSLQENIVNYNQIVVQKDDENAELKIQVAGLKEKLKNAVSQDNAAEVLQKKIDSLQENIIKFNQIIAQKDDENAELKKQVILLQGKQVNGVLEKNVFEAEQVKEQKKELEALRRDNFTLNKIIEGKIKEMEALNKEKAQLKGAQREPLDSARDKELQQKLEAVSQERDLLKQAVESQKNEANELGRQIALLQKGNDSIGQVTQANSELKNQVNNLEQKINELEKNQSVLESMSLSALHALRQPELVNAAEVKAGRVIHLNLAYAYAVEGKQKQAINEYRKVLAADPVNEDAHYNLACLLVKEKKYKEAAEEYNLALKGLPKDADAYYNLYVLYTTKLNDLKLADQYYQKHLESVSLGKKD